MTAWAIYVLDFLFAHSAISRISILTDMQNYTTDCNSVLTQRGFSLSLKNDMSSEDKSMFIFILTSAMQVAFLGNETVKQLLGYDFTKNDDRAAYISKLVDVIFDGRIHSDE